MALIALLAACGHRADDSVDTASVDSNDTGDLPPLERQTGEEVLGGDYWTGDAGDGLGAVMFVGETAWLSAAQRDGGVGAVCHAGETGPVEPCWTGRTSRGFLGNSVAAHGDHLAAGAFWDDTGGSWAGSVFLLDDAGGSAEDASATWSGTGGDYAGSSLSVGDLTGDGGEDLAVGGFAAGANSVGRIWLVDGSGGSLEDASDLVEGSVADGWLGMDSSVGDVDGDGQDDLFAGAVGENAEAGAAYLFLGPIAGTVVSGDSDVRVYGEATFGYAGKSVALGDVDGDGLDDLAVAESDIDRVHLILGPGDSGPLSGSDASISGAGRFGFSLESEDLDRDGFADLAVGSTRFEETGAAFVFYGPFSGELTHEDADWTLLGEAASDKAGIEVQIFSNQLFVGASGPEDGAGRVYRP
ncbi:MAG TPA: integrin alpha [Myxococcota bacterium]|nr:integrin alpha [Myxococcota bacterium]